jgi:hypothetical protein
MQNIEWAYGFEEKQEKKVTNKLLRVTDKNDILCSEKRSFLIYLHTPVLS